MKVHLCVIVAALCILSTSKYIVFTNETECPQGFTQFNVGCRTIVIQGSTTLNGKAYSCNLNQRGGQFQHTMTQDELASHNHRSGTVIHVNQYGGGTLIDQRRDLVGGTSPYYQTPYTSTTGKSTPFNVRDPYIVLKACIQINNLSTSTGKYLAVGAIAGIVSLTFQTTIMIYLCYKKRS